MITLSRRFALTGYENLNLTKILESFFILYFLSREIHRNNVIFFSFTLSIMILAI